MTGPKRAALSRRHQHLIVTIFGLYGRDRDHVVAVSALIRLLAVLGVEAAGVRSSVSRLKRRGVLESARHGGVAAYRLSPRLDDVFRAGDERIFAPRRAKTGDPWILASFSVPESDRHLRHQIRGILTRAGCGQVTSGLWIAPATVEADLQRTIARAKLDTYVELFEARPLTKASVKANVRRWWDLDSLDHLYREFVARYGPLERRRGDDDARAFGEYVSLVTEWRRLPYLDPGLPLEYLPRRWNGDVAKRLFFRLNARLAPRARRFADSIMQ